MRIDDCQDISAEGRSSFVQKFGLNLSSQLLSLKSKLQTLIFDTG